MGVDAAPGESLYGWPAGRRIRAEEVASARESQSMTVLCGWRGCRASFVGPVEDATAALAEHRVEEHPDFVPWRRPRVRRPRYGEPDGLHG